MIERNARVDMLRFIKHKGIVVPLDRVDIDTDQIIPKQFLKRIKRSGFGQFLFYDWRFNEDGTTNVEFVLNEKGYEKGSILVSGRNFGSGSSREHAPWALMDYGFRCIIAPSYADIFQKNCFINGLVPVLLPQDIVGEIMLNAMTKPGYSLTVDLEAGTVFDESDMNIAFKLHDDADVNDFRRHCLLNGLDDIGLTLQHEDKIKAYENIREKRHY